MKKTVNSENDAFISRQEDNVKLVVGPVLGKITKTSAVVLLEVWGTQKYLEVECLVLQGTNMTEVQHLKKKFISKIPGTFFIQDLKPDTPYKLIFGGIIGCNQSELIATFRTQPKKIERFRIAAFSCNKFDYVLLGQPNPVKYLLDRVRNIDLALHLGDQVYMPNHLVEDIQIYLKNYDSKSPKKKEIMMARVKDQLRNVYRQTWRALSMDKFLSQVPNLMIWSDNEVANDFSSMKRKEGGQYYKSEFLKWGMEVYMEYQRQLWDPNESLNFGDSRQVEEWHYHVYDQIGIFMFDMRGNRISREGIQQDEQDLISEKQWRDLESFANQEELRVLILCSEMPYIGHSPGIIREEAKEADFLRDHWWGDTNQKITLKQKILK